MIWPPLFYNASTQNPDVIADLIIEYIIIWIFLYTSLATCFQVRDCLKILVHFWAKWFASEKNFKHIKRCENFSETKLILRQFNLQNFKKVRKRVNFETNLFKVNMKWIWSKFEINSKKIWSICETSLEQIC